MIRLDDIIARLEQLRQESSPADDEQTGEISRWRDRIDGIDQILLALLNERSRTANKIGHIKNESQLPIYVPEREKQVLLNVLDGNDGPLNDAAVRRLFERIIDETRSQERQQFQARKSQKKGGPNK